MGYKTNLSILVVIVAIGWTYLKSNSSPTPEELGHGSFVAKGWERVEETFRQQLKSGLLTGGGFAVYHKGRCVVDLSGGHANKESHMLWDNETVSIYFSTTKGVASVVMAMLVERGLLDYKKPVSTYWPEFAQNGKKDITVEQLFSHQAGLITINEGNYSFFDMERDPDGFGETLAAQKPYWEPGTGFGYHGLTKGFYENELVKRLDPKHRTMKQFFQEEVADVFGIDFYIGLPRQQFYRLAKNHDASPISTEILTDPVLWPLVWMVMSQSNPFFSLALYTNDAYSWTNPYFVEIGSPATHGAGTTASLAKFYGILANGGVYGKKKLLSKKLIKQLYQPVVSGLDLVLGINWTLGPGPVIIESPTGSPMFGTPGAGGQNAYADPENQLGVAYLTNYMSYYGTNDPRFVGLMKAVYEVIKDQKV